MIKILIIITIIVAVLFGGWQLFDYWQKIENEKETKKEAAASALNPDQLPGMDGQLQPSLDAAEKQGPDALRIWMATYGRNVQDPKLAWIQLDYCVMITRETPAEAKKIFRTIKDRTPHSSPVWPRVRELEKSYE